MHLENIKLYKIRLLIFLEYAIWGSYLTTIAIYLMNSLSFNTGDISFLFLGFGIASVLVILPINIIGDKLLSATHLYTICLFCSSCCLFILSTLTNKNWFYLWFTINTFFYIPTIALSQAIQVYWLKKYKYELEEELPILRIFSTLGFIFAIWLIALLNLQSSHWQLIIGGIFCLVCCILSLFIEKVPVFKDKSNKVKLGEFIKVSFNTLNTKSFRILSLVIICMGILSQVNNVYGQMYIKELGYTHYSFIYTIGILSAIGIKYFYEKLYNIFSIKNLINIAIISWIVRICIFLLFGNIFPLLIIGMIIYGLCFDLFLVTLMIIIDNSVSKKMRATGQAVLLVLFNGGGIIIGTYITHLTSNINDSVNFSLLWSSCLVICFIALGLNSLTENYKKKIKEH